MESSTPKYYKRCSVVGRKILSECGFDSFLFDYECAYVIDKLELNFYEGNILKYLWRISESNKSSIDSDFKKAIHYSEMAIERGTEKLFIFNFNSLKKSDIQISVNFKLPENF